MDKVLITGGSGFVGKWMRLTAPGNVAVFPLDRHDYANGAWRDVRWEYIVHLAPIMPDLVVSQAAKDNARLLYCSSGIVYHPENNTEYRRNKINWEQYCLDSGVDVVIARLFAFIGEGLDDNKAIVQFEKRAKAGQPLHIWGDGSCVRSYMPAAEMGAWMWAILFRGVSGEAYDVGDNTPVTMTELAKRYSDNIVYELDNPVPMPVYLPVDTDKTKCLLD